MVFNPGIPPERSYVYIDGGYLRERIKSLSRRHFNGEELPLDFGRYFGDFEKKFYYDCLPPRQANEPEDDFKKREERVQALFDGLREKPGFHVYEGKLTGQGEKARQKGVDIQLAVHMLSHVSRGTIRKITLVAGDADFEPLADAVVAEGGYLCLWADRLSVSRRLIHAVDVFQPMEVNRFLHSLSEEFHHAHSMPRTSGELAINPEGLPQIRSGRLSTGGKVGLYSDGRKALLIYPTGKTHFMHIRWHSPEAVANLAEDFGQTIVWDNA